MHVNFAPVIDVNSNPLNPVIGSRSFGESVPWVSRLGQAYADGLQDVHVLATAKHFPGHGDSDSDSHKTLPTISHPRARLDSIELAPFAHAFDHGMGAVMVAHLDIPSLDSTEAQPSTLSPLIVDSLLRDEMGFEGLVFTDAMSMKGFADFVGDRPRIRDAILAGNDVLLFPATLKRPLKKPWPHWRTGPGLRVRDPQMPSGVDGQIVVPRPRFHSTGWNTVGTAHADVIHRESIAQSLTVLPGLILRRVRRSSPLQVASPCSTSPTTMPPAPHSKPSARTCAMHGRWNVMCWGKTEADSAGRRSRTHWAKQTTSW